jgi:PAS domain S-box-containing protein
MSIISKTMGNKKVLVVEDEIAIAEEIIDRLEGLGFDVSGTASSGEDAIKKAEEVRPDLVLMDIKLEGAMDGVEAAGQIHTRFGVPVVYLTAHSDRKTLERAKVTEPFGYITKPFEDRDLKIGVEIALYKHEMEKELKQYRENLEDLVEERTAEIKELKEFNESIVQSIQEGIIIENGEGVITFANQRMLEMFGTSKDELIDKHWSELFSSDSEKKVKEENAKVEEGDKTRYEATLDFKDLKLSVMVCATPRIEKGHYAGNLKEFIDITERKEAEEMLRKKALKYKIEKGRSYLVTEKALERGADVFRDLLEAGYTGIVMSRAPKKEMIESVGDGVKMLQFSGETTGKGTIPPQLDVVNKYIEDFASRDSVVLLDRLDYLIVQNSFKDVLRFLNRLSERIYASKAVLVIVVDPGTLSDQQLSLLEKETHKVKAKYHVELATDLQDILEFVKNENDRGRNPVHKDVMKTFNITRPTATKKLKELKSKELVVEKKWGRFKTLVLTEKGKEVL